MVYYLADNIISALGFTTSANFEAMKAGRVGIRTVDDNKLYPEPFPAALVDTEEMEKRFAELADPAQFTRLEKMLILSVSDALDAAETDIRSPRTGIILSTTKGNIDLLDGKHSFDKNRDLLWRLGEVIGRFFGNPNRVTVLSNACVSGVLAQNIAAMLIRNGTYDQVVVTGGDIVSRFVVSGFMSFLSLSPGPCKPFDKTRDGLSLGEAAGTVILGKQPDTGTSLFWAGGGSANDANHISGPSRTGEGAFIAMAKAFREAGIHNRDIDHISAHGTATPYNDEMESIAIGRHGLENSPVNSLKGYWGHTLGAAGLIETAALAEEMRQNTLLATAGFSEHGVSRPIAVIDRLQNAPLNCCLKMASGFGGSNASLILEKISDRKSQITNHKSQITNHKSQITASVRIHNKQVKLNGRVIFEDPSAGDTATFLKNFYRHLKPGYAKFFKMDELSKLGFLAAEVLLSGDVLKDFSSEDVAVVLSNAHSTKVTDSRFLETVVDDEQFFPSPAVFVYTLPNIVTGEISIRHKLKGEQAFFIFDDFNAGFLTAYINTLLASGKAKACLGGWVDQSEEKTDAFFYFVTTKLSEKHLLHNSKNVQQLTLI